MDAVEVLIGEEPEIIEKLHATDGQLTPLHISVLCCHPDVASLLLDRKANPNCATVHQIRPLHLASSNSEEIADLLIRANALVNARDTDDATPLHFAVTYHRVAIISLLLASGASIGLSNRWGVLPLHVLCAYANVEGSFQVVQQLCAAKADPWLGDNKGLTPLEVATKVDEASSIIVQWIAKFEDDKPALAANADALLNEAEVAAMEEETERRKAVVERSATEFAGDDEDRAKKEEEERAETEQLKQNAMMLQKSMAVQLVMDRQTEKLEDRVRELEKEVENTKRIQKQAENNLANADETIEKLRGMLKQREQAQLEGQAQLPNALQAEDILRLEKECQHLKQVHEESKVKHQEEIAEWKRKINSEKEKKDAEKDKTNSEKGDLENKILALETRNTELQAANAEIQAAKQHLETTNAEIMAAQKKDGADKNSAQTKLMEQMKEQLTNQITELLGQMKTLEQDKLGLAQLHDKEKKESEREKEDLVRAKEAVEEAKDEIEKNFKEEQDGRKAVEDQLDQKTKDYQEIRVKLEELNRAQSEGKLHLEMEKNKLEEEKIELENKLANAGSALAAARAECSELADKAGDVELEKARADKAEMMFGALEEQNTALESLYAQEQAIRKKYHNQLQDLKGAIRVYCRVRPKIAREKDDAIGLRKLDAFVVELDGKGGKGAKQFTFDSIFDGESTQEMVFKECVDLMQSALDGYNVTVFAYGQTGAGKTHTMYGNPDMPGLVPRTTAEIFRLVDRDRSKADLTVKMYMVELYCNDLVDLLRPKKGKPDDLNIKRDSGGRVYIENVTEKDVNSADEIENYMKIGFDKRHVSATKMNAGSSRSHLIVSILINVINKTSKKEWNGKITLCDLAGSERLKKSEASGDQIKEAVAINKSLTALGDVIEALTSGSKHVPYRNHRLTELMSDSLGGNAKTLMFVNCSPAKDNIDETQSSLGYATRAKQITNSASKESGGGKEVARLKEVIATMAKELKAKGGGDALPP